MSLSNVSQDSYLTQGEKRYLLTPLAMVIPNIEGIYNYSQYQQSKIVTETQFEAFYKPNVKLIRFGTLENNYPVRAYGGTDGWFLAQEA